MNNKNKFKQGFTLIELAIVMVIVGLLMSGIFSVYKQYIINKREAEFTATMNTVTSAMAYYIIDNGLLVPAVADDGATAGINESFDPARFPCPAAPNLPPSNAMFGVEQRNPATGRCLVTGGIVSAPGTGGDVYIGSIPFVTLDISGKSIVDPYGPRMTYAVSDTVSSAMPQPLAQGGALGGPLNPSGSITVQVLNGAGAVDSTRTNIPFVIVSHGPNGLGARNVDGSLVRACGNTTRDAENCDGDATFIDAALYRVEADNIQAYDDTINFSLRGIADKEDFWGLGNNTQDIVSLNPRRVGMGNDATVPAPRAQVDIMGERNLIVGITNSTLTAGPTLPQSTAQAASPMNSFGFIEAPWIYTAGCIEGGLKNAQTTAMCLGRGLANNSLSGANEISFYTAGNRRVQIRPSGNVGINIIGGAEPSERLEVNGNIMARTFLHSSDLRLKKNITDLDADALKKIMMMRIVEFDMIDSPEKYKKIGVIAQEMKKIYPQLVHEGSNGFMSVDYVGLSGPIIKGLQELNTEKTKEIEKLNGDIEKLNADMDDLKTRLVALEEKKIPVEENPAEEPAIDKAPVEEITPDAEREEIKTP